MNILHLHNQRIVKIGPLHTAKCTEHITCPFKIMNRYNHIPLLHKFPALGFQYSAYLISYPIENLIREKKLFIRTLQDFDCYCFNLIKLHAISPFTSFSHNIVFYVACVFL